MRFTKYLYLIDTCNDMLLLGRSILFRKRERILYFNAMCGTLNHQFYMLYIICFYYFSKIFFSDLFGKNSPSLYFGESVVTVFREIKTQFYIMLEFVSKRDFLFPTLSKLLAATNWLEREIFDMYGIVFFNHPNLRRILTDYGFKGFPLRKDFPVFGFKELRYDNEIKQLMYTPVVLAQSWRNYLFIKQW